MPNVDAPAVQKRLEPEEKKRPCIARPSSIALARLIAEVRVSEENTPSTYNRTYHRHNR